MIKICFIILPLAFSSCQIKPAIQEDLSLKISQSTSGVMTCKLENPTDSKWFISGYPENRPAAIVENWNGEEWVEAMPLRCATGISPCLLAPGESWSFEVRSRVSETRVSVIAWRGSWSSDSSVLVRGALLQDCSRIGNPHSNWPSVYGMVFERADRYSSLICRPAECMLSWEMKCRRINQSTFH